MVIPSIILQGCYAFQFASGETFVARVDDPSCIPARRCTPYAPDACEVPAGIYCGVDDGDGEEASACGTSTAGDANAPPIPFFFCASSRLRCVRTACCAAALFSALAASIRERSGIRARSSGGSCCILLCLSASACAASGAWCCD